MRHPLTPNCLNCAPVNKVDRQLLVSPRQGGPSPLFPPCLAAPPEYWGPEPAGRISPPSCAPAWSPAPSCSPLCAAAQCSPLGHGANTHNQTGTDAGECRRGNWQVGLAAGFLELTPGWAEPRDPHVRGGPARREAGRDDRQEARGWRRSTSHQATFRRCLDSVMLIVHLL